MILLHSQHCQLSSFYHYLLLILLWSFYNSTLYPFLQIECCLGCKLSTSTQYAPSAAPPLSTPRLQHLHSVRPVCSTSTQYAPSAAPPLSTPRLQHLHSVRPVCSTSTQYAPSAAPPLSTPRLQHLHSVRPVCSTSTQHAVCCFLSIKFACYNYNYITIIITLQTQQLIILLLNLFISPGRNIPPPPPILQSILLKRFFVSEKGFNCMLPFGSCSGSTYWMKVWYVLMILQWHHYYILLHNPGYNVPSKITSPSPVVTSLFPIWKWLASYTVTLLVLPPSR